MRLMKSAQKLSLGFVTGFLTCFLFFGGTVAFAASGIMTERSTNRVFVDGREVQLEAYMIEGHNYSENGRRYEKRVSLHREAESRAQ